VLSDGDQLALLNAGDDQGLRPVAGVIGLGEVDLAVRRGAVEVGDRLDGIANTRAGDIGAAADAAGPGSISTAIAASTA